MGSTNTPGKVAILEGELQQALEEYTARHPLSRQSHNEAARWMPGGNTRTVLYTSPFPLTISSANSCQLTTVDGHVYTDFLSEYTAGIYGHNHPIIRKAIEKALDNGWNYGAHHAMEQELAKLVCERFPAIKKVRFVNSGTEANMMALATAVAYTGKRKIIIFNKGYHGSTIAGRAEEGGIGKEVPSSSTLETSLKPSDTASKSNSPKLSINLPHDFIVGQYNDVEGTKLLIDSLPVGALAAILVEPMLGSAGCFKGSYDFLALLRELATQHRALLIFDEVMTSRLHYNGYGSSIGLVPDLMTIGKWIGGGMSFGAFGGRDDIMSLYDPRKGQLDHPGTFNNNVFSMSAGVAGCQLLDSSRLTALNQLGDETRIAIEAVFEKYELTGVIPSYPLPDEKHVSDDPQKPPQMFITGVGSMMNIHFSGPHRNSLATLFYHHMLEEGVYMAPRGLIALNVELTREDCDRLVQAVDSFCSLRCNRGWA